MAKAIGPGGIFFKSREPAALSAWYAKHLGLHPEDWGSVRFDEDAARPGFTLWAPFAAATDYFAPSTHSRRARSRTWSTSASTIPTSCSPNCALPVWWWTTASRAAHWVASAGSWIHKVRASSCGNRPDEPSIQRRA